MSAEAKFSVRVSEQDKKLIQEAAQIMGYRTMSSFIASTMVLTAKRVKSEEIARLNSENQLRARTLSDVDRDILLDLLESPPEPNQKLVELMQSSRHRKS